MNYLTEIKLFYDWLETHDLTPSGIALWHALMFIANRCGWKEKFAASNSILESRTQMPRTTIYRARKRLQSFGLIDVFPQGSNNSSLYTLNSLKGVLAFQNNGQNETQNETHNGTQPAENGNHAFQSAFQSETPILNYTDLLKKKENKKRKKNGSASSKKGKEKSSAKKEKEKAFSIDQWVKTIDSPWRELMLLWLEYKRVRKESYRSEIGAKSCLTRLKKLSGENPAIAQQIIETSMANNWAGLFELKQSSASRPQYGQRIGQIIQSDDQARRQRMMEKLRNAGNNKPDNNQQFRRLIIFGQSAEFLHFEEVFVGEILFTEVFIDDGVICQHSSYKKFRLTFPYLIFRFVCIIRILHQTGTAKIIRIIRDITQPLTTQEY